MEFLPCVLKRKMNESTEKERKADAEIKRHVHGRDSLLNF